MYSVQCTVYSVQCTVHSAQCTVHSVQCTVYSVQCTCLLKDCCTFLGDKQPEKRKVNRIRLEEGQTQPWNVRNVSAPGSHFARLSVWGCTSKQRSGRFECILWSPCYLELNRPYPGCYILHIALQLRSLSIHPLANWVIQWLCTDPINKCAVWFCSRLIPWCSVHTVNCIPWNKCRM